MISASTPDLSTSRSGIMWARPESPSSRHASASPRHGVTHTFELTIAAPRRNASATSPSSSCPSGGLAVPRPGQKARRRKPPGAPATRSASAAATRPAACTGASLAVFQGGVRDLFTPGLRPRYPGVGPRRPTRCRVQLRGRAIPGMSWLGAGLLLRRGSSRSTGDTSRPTTTTPPRSRQPQRAPFPPLLGRGSSPSSSARPGFPAARRRRRRHGGATRTPYSPAGFAHRSRRGWRGAEFEYVHIVPGVPIAHSRPGEQRRARRPTLPDLHKRRCAITLPKCSAVVCVLAFLAEAGPSLFLLSATRKRWLQFPRHLRRAPAGPRRAAATSLPLVVPHRRRGRCPPPDAAPPRRPRPTASLRRS